MAAATQDSANGTSDIHSQPLGRKPCIHLATERNNTACLTLLSSQGPPCHLLCPCVYSACGYHKGTLDLLVLQVVMCCHVGASN